jgi:hypothetical protein
VDLPTYTNIWRIEKRLYKLYDFRLPMPLPINWIAVFAGITIPYILLLIAVGLPFNHTLVWLYVLPPGVLTWLTTRPVIEGKRLPELVESQARYLTEPRTWVRLTPLSEKDQVVLTARVWRSRQVSKRRAPAARPVPAKRPALPAAEPGRQVGTLRPGPVLKPTSVFRPEPASGAGPVLEGRPTRQRQLSGTPQRARAQERVRGQERARGEARSRIPVLGQSLGQGTARRAPELPPARQLPPPGPAAAPERPGLLQSPFNPVLRPGSLPGTHQQDEKPSVPTTPDAVPPVAAVVASAPVLPSPPPAPAAPPPVQPWPGPAAPADPPAPVSRPAQSAQPAPVPVRARLGGLGGPGLEVSHDGPRRRQPAVKTPPAQPEQSVQPVQPVEPEPVQPVQPVQSVQPVMAAPVVQQRPAAPLTPSVPPADPAPDWPIPARPLRPAPSPLTEDADATRTENGTAQAAPAASSAPPAPAEPAHAEPGPLVPTASATPAAPSVSAAPAAPPAPAVSVPGEVAYAEPAPAAPLAPPAAAPPAPLVPPVAAAAAPAPVAEPPFAGRPAAVPAETPVEASVQPLAEALAEPPVRQVPAPVDAAAAPQAPAPAPQPPAPAPAPVVQQVSDRKQSAVPSIERALSGPSRDMNASWGGKVKIITGNGAAQGPGARDQEAQDRNRARLPIAEPRRILILGCTSGAGQSVTALMAASMLASLREQPVAAVDLHDGTLARYRAPAAWLEELLAGRPPQTIGSTRPDGLHPTPKPSPARLDVVASHEPLKEGDEIKLAVQLNRHYPLTLLDPGAAGLTRLLKVTDQLVVVVPANVDGAVALADTRDWLDNNGHADLAMQSVTVINGVSRRSLSDVENAESIARGRSRAIVRVPWDDMLPVAAANPSTLRPQTRVAYTALAGVLVARLAAAAPARKRSNEH